MGGASAASSPHHSGYAAQPLIIHGPIQAGSSGKISRHALGDLATVQGHPAGICEFDRPELTGEFYLAGQSKAAAISDI
jgi:hypothetical protein